MSINRKELDRHITGNYGEDQFSDDGLLDPKDCEHIQVETLYQYDNEKNRSVFWVCLKCHVLFEPKGLGDANLHEALRQIHNQGAGIGGSNFDVHHYAEFSFRTASDALIEGGK